MSEIGLKQNDKYPMYLFICENGKDFLRGGEMRKVATGDWEVMEIDQVR